MFVGALAKCKALFSKLTSISGSRQFDKLFIIPVLLNFSISFLTHIKPM